jgi:signal transduction histidine kinase
MFARLDDSFRRERQFTNDASHELRTPLAAMQAILSVIRSRKRTSAEYERALDDLSEETERLHTLVENLLQLARANKRDNHPFEKVNLSLLIRDVVDSLRALAEQKNLTLTASLPDDLIMLGDSDELIRLFVNLIDNAIKYTEQGFILVSAIKQLNEIEIKISDSGIGIAEAHLPHIFDRFYQVDPARSGKGSGLGLAIAKEIVQAHSGRITVESQVGLGTTFIIRFPRYN